MKTEIFSIPIFMDRIDVSKIEMSDTDYKPTWLSGVKSNYWSGAQLEPNSYDYLVDIIDRNLQKTGSYTQADIRGIWRNSYETHDTQEVHIHANSQWSFIIYETVEKSRTVFLNPAWKSIESQFGDLCPAFPINWRPKVDPGTIIIFPSFLEHYVVAGNKGSTIAGNIHLEYCDGK